MRPLLLAILVGSCARPPLEPTHDAHGELVTIAAVGTGSSIWDVLGEPIARGRHYAVIDDRGYVGTLRVESVMPCMLACVGCCTKPQWWTKWVEPPRRDRPEGLVLAIGPVDAQYASARRELPVSVEPDGNPSEQASPWTFVDTDELRTLARFTFGSEPDVLEARGRRIDGARVVELRVHDRKGWRVVSRTVEQGEPRGWPLD